MRAVKEDGLLRHRHDEPALGGLRGVDIVLAEAQAGIGHSGANLGHRVAQAAYAGNPLAVQPRRNRVDQLRQHERLLVIRVEDLRLNDLAGDVREGGHVHRLAGLQQAHAALARIHLPHPLGANRRLGQFADAEIRRPEVARPQGFLQVGDGLLRPLGVVHALQLSILDRSHVGILQDKRDSGLVIRD